MTLHSLFTTELGAHTSSSVSRQRPDNREILPEWWCDGWKEPVRSHQRPETGCHGRGSLKAACAVQDTLPTPTPALAGGLRTPASQCTYMCPPEPLGAHWSCSQCWWRGEGRGGPKAQASSCHSGRTEWRPRKRRPDGAHPQPTTSGLYHPIRPHRSFCLCDLSSSLSLESVTHRSALTAFLSPGLT